MTTETTYNIDHTNKELHCWTCHTPTMDYWRRNFPDYITKQGGNFVEMNGIPLGDIQRLTIRKKRVLTEEQKDIMRERGKRLHEQNKLLAKRNA